MDDPTNPRERDANVTPPAPGAGPHGGVDVSGGELRAGRDVVGGDVNVAGDSITGQTVTVQRGFSASDVQRISLMVGGLVFATAACFFIFGAISAAALVGVLNRPLAGGGSSPEAARSMQNKIGQIQALQPGEQFRVGFTEDEVSSYFRFILGPEIGVSNGRARFLDNPGQIAVAGNLDSAGGRPFIGQLSVTTGPRPFRLDGAWIKLFGPEQSSFGWVPVTPLAQNLTDQLNDRVFGRVQLNQVLQTGGGPSAPPEAGNSLILTGAVR